MKSDSKVSNVTLFTHQDGKKFEVTIVRLDESLDLDSGNSRSYREEDWDSDDWDEDAEDWAEPPAPQPQSQALLQLRRHRVAKQYCTEEALLVMTQQRPEATGAEREDDRRVHDWDGDAEDLEERPVPKWSERPDRPDGVRRARDADVWRTRLGED